MSLKVVHYKTKPSEHYRYWQHSLLEKMKAGDGRQYEIEKVLYGMFCNHFKIPLKDSGALIAGCLRPAVEHLDHWSFHKSGMLEYIINQPYTLTPNYWKMAIHGDFTIIPQKFEENG